ncbi:MAG TPA: sulfatase [Thermoguttaceae bacterium]|nr:sulfatase [Thermoguttaceae bacterium]
MNGSTQRTAILIGLALLATALPATGAERPNVLFILSDDHAAHAVSAYGSRINRTPNIDRLARDGALFRNCFAVNSICAPSRASILTGVYGHMNGVRTNAGRLRPDLATFPKLLREAGYATAVVGKWHLKDPPEGFDHACVLPGQGAYFDPVMIAGGEKRRFPGYVSEVITDEAIRWLGGRDSGKPFCLLVHHKAPHANWEPGPRQADLFRDAPIPEPTTFDDDYATRGQAIRDHRLFVGPKLWELHYQRRLGEIPATVGEGEVRRWVYQRFITDYLRCVASVDESVGRLLDHLDAAGLADDTMVVYTSDQGFFLGDHGLYDKRFMYDESIRMPLVVRWPGKTRGGTEVDSLVLNVDFAPTLLDVAGLSPPDAMQGQSFEPLLRGERPSNWREAMYYRFYEQAFGIGPHEGVRTARYKLIHYLYGDQARELYDLEQDPEELHNVFGDAEYTDVAVQLQTRLAELRKQFGAEPVAAPSR